MKVLVTGGAGYVGSHVVQSLLEAGHEPVVFDNLSAGHAAAVKDAELIVGDVTDRDQLMAMMRKFRFDGVVHLAAISLVGESMKNPSSYFHNNVEGGLALFDALVSTQIPWVLLSSTAATYGNPEHVPVPETHRQLPTNPYGESKLMLERILGWYESAYGLRSGILRYFNAAGAHPGGQIGEDHTPETHLIPIMMEAALGQRAAVDVFGSDYATTDGTAIRDYVHVCDLADAHLALMQRLHGDGPSDTFNLGSQHGYSVMEILETTRRITGREIPMRMAPRRAGDPPVLVADATRARTVLGWETRFTLDRIVDTAWQWHVAHPDGFRR